MKIQFKDLYSKNEEDILDEWYISPTSCDRPNIGDHIFINNEEFEVRIRTWHGQELLVIDLMPLNRGYSPSDYPPIL